jgi:serine/arginine repetitive matrix protein 1
MAMQVDDKMLRNTKFPPEFSQKVDMKKVNLEVMKKYVQEILGIGLLEL